MRRLRDRVRPERLRDARGLPLEHVARGLGRHVPRREPGAAGREHEPRRRRASSRIARGDLVALVGNDAPLDLEPSPREQLLEGVAAPVLPRPGHDAVRDRQHRGLQMTRSFVFSTRTTSTIRISLSTALAMS